MKLVQASVDAPGRFVVVTRYKKDYLHFSRRGGKITSNVDARLVIQANSGTFRSRENFVVQVRYQDVLLKKTMPLPQRRSGFRSSICIRFESVSCSCIVSELTICAHVSRHVTCCQIHPVDSHTVSEVRKTAPDGAGLLVTSAVIDVEWSSRDFGSPVKVRHRHCVVVCPH